MTVRGTRRSPARWLAVAAVGGGMALLSAAAPARAQWHVGLQGGVTASALTGQAARGADPALGAGLSVDLEHWLSPAWVVDIDAGVLQRGAADLAAGGRVVDVRLNYLEVPVTLGRTFALSDGWRWGPFAGAAVGWLQQCGVRSEGEFAYTACSPASPVGRPDRFDVSIPIGIAVRHRYPGGARLALDLRYSHSLRPVLDSRGDGAWSQLLQVLFGFTLPLGDPADAPDGGRP